MTYPPANPDAQELLDVATEAAMAAGSHAMEHSARRHEMVVRTAHDIKLRLDIECQGFAERVIRSKFPRHAFLGEENTPETVLTAEPANSAYRWIVDPIDGTVNFSHGLPFWCCSVACRHHGKTIAGAVFAPALNQLYQASLETPTSCNGKAIQVSNTESLATAMILSAVDMNLHSKHEPLSLFRDIALRSQKGRILGSAALDLCMVASGAADGYVEASIFLWDIAAGELMVRQAGGTAEALRPEDNTHRLAFMASNGRIHNELKTLVAPAIVTPHQPVAPLPSAET